ncbi:MAG: hypothetical protein J6Z41_04350 [Prevotella sp.]|nr:hypothetical protein [Prevotella sp.]
MASKRTQNIVAEGRFTLPLLAVLCGVLWIWFGLLTQQLWIQTAFVTISTLLMVTLNNSNSLIRIYSRMVSSSFLLLTTMAMIRYTSVRGCTLQMCLIAFYMCIFRTYQNRKSSGWMYYAFLCLSMASLVFVKVLYLVPVVWLLCTLKFYSLNVKTFVASLLGLFTPYWFILPWLIMREEFYRISTHFSPLWQFSPLCDISRLSMRELITFALILILALTGTIHYVRTGYNDKIRTRMLYSFFITICWATIIFLVLQPLHYNELIPMIIVSVSPLIAHFLALTHTWFTNLAFWLFFLAISTLTVLNICNPSLIF